MAPKKKLTKKERARLEAEQAELLRIEMEKEKQRKQAEERERMQREREEAEKRQKQEIIENRQRRQQLKKSVLYFTGIKEKIDEIHESEIQEKQWQQYMRCNGLPNASIPGDLRKYIHMWHMENKIKQIDERNWLLKTNERTVLTQDKDIKNLTRVNLRKLQGNLGDEYSYRVNEILGILQGIDEAISDSSLVESIVNDLIKLKSEFRDSLNEFIDEFTYRILSHISRDMELESPGMSKHTYSSNVLKSQISTIQGEMQTPPKNKTKESSRHSEINFTLLELQLLLPHRVKLTNSALRGLWLNYDHFSDYCPSFSMPNLNRKKLNILQQTKKEWKKRKEILQSTLDQTIKDTPISSFDMSDNLESRIVDVDKVYTEYEDEQNRLRRKNLGVESLKLSEFDVNLRSHRIIGGVFSIDYLEQPQQDMRLNSQSFIRTIIAPNKLQRKQFHQSYKPPPPPQPGVRRLPEEIEAEMKMVERNLEKLGVINLQLPDSVLWLEPPIVCRWETPIETVESERFDALQQTTEAAKLPRPKEFFNSMSTDTTTSVSQKPETIPEIVVIDQRKDSIVKKRRRSSRPLLDHEKPVKNITDFDMCDIPSGVDIYGLVMDFVVPRLPNGYCVRMEYQKKDRCDSILRYLTKSESLKDSTKMHTVRAVKCKTIQESFSPTSSPRPFHPIIKFDKILQVQQKRRSSISEDGKSDESVSYMFSQLVEDLDKIYELQCPYLDDEISEINEKLITSPVEVSRKNSLMPPATDDSPSTVSGRRFSGILIIREFETLEKDKKGNIKKPNDSEEEDSGSEYEDDDENPENAEFDEVNDVSDFAALHGKWSTRDVHDAKFNDDKLSIQFRIGRLGFFGFAANRYSNLPYQTWEIKPDFKMPGTVVFSLTAAVISIELQISKSGYCVNSLQGGTTESLTRIIGKTVTFADLKSTLITSSIDIFPEEDAFCYTEGSCEKNFVMEMHLYNCMSTLALSHNFTWSRWNLLSGSRTVVLLMRELVENKKIPNHSTLFVTPLKASIIECTEVSASFSSAGIPGMEFYADLHNLAQDHALPLSKEKQTSMEPILRDYIAEILMSTRPLSFC